MQRRNAAVEHALGIGRGDVHARADVHQIPLGAQHRKRVIQRQIDVALARFALHNRGLYADHIGKEALQRLGSHGEAVLRIHDAGVRRERVCALAALPLLQARHHVGFGVIPLLGLVFAGHEDLHILCGQLGVFGVLLAGHTVEQVDRGVNQRLIHIAV